MSSTSNPTTPPFELGQKVTTTYFFLNNQDPKQVFKVTSVRPYKYSSTGWMVLVDSDEYPELDSRWFTPTE
jgi:prolyl oligopeptidase PreP (S9A serine peptidase family)